MESTNAIVDQLLAKRDSLVASVQRAVDELIQTDALTGIRNKRGLDEALEETLAGDSDLWCAFVEIDKFKAINTKFGYTAADGYLIKFARTLQELASQFESEAFRAHGDEFYLLGNCHGEGTVEQFLDSVLNGVRELNVQVLGRDDAMRCTASVGWTFVGADSPDEATPNILLKNLELAVDSAKKQGRDMVVRHQPGMAKEITLEVRTECVLCGVRFTVDLPQGARPTTLCCPHCGHSNPLAREDAEALESHQD